MSGGEHKAHVWGLFALTTAIFLRPKRLRFRKPSQARTERGLRIFIPFHFQADVQHRVHSRRDCPTPLTLYLTLQLTQEGRVDDTIARNVCRPTRGGVDLIQRSDKKLVGVLLRVSGQF